MAKASICRNCFHSYVCEQFNENKDDNNEKCHFLNDHYVPIADVVPKSEVDEIVRQWKEEANCWQNNYIAELRDNEQIKQEVAREIFEEMQSCLIQRHWNGLDIVSFEFDAVKYAELKKKYTESEGKE